MMNLKSLGKFIHSFMVLLQSYMYRFLLEVGIYSRSAATYLNKDNNFSAQFDH